MIIESIKIPQYSHRYNNFNDLNADKPIKKNFLGFAEQIDINELLQLEQVFVIAEPGHGKTTLMEEIKTCFIKQKISYISLNGSDYNGELFESKNGCEYFIFDALDECKDVLPTFIEILRLCKENTLKLIISNRTHYLSMISHLLVKDSFVYYQLLPFSDEQIKTFMDSKIKQLHFLDKDYNEIIKRSKVNSKSSILSVPRYLDEFCKFILKEDKRAEDIKELTKTEIFEKVIYYKLEAEVKRKNENSNQKDLTKRVLERLSLVMEIQELNQISKEDFITFLDQTDSNISLIFLNLVNLDDLLDRVMKRTGDKLQFENSEFQEYLAAKELVRIGHRFQTIYDLMIDKDLQLLLPNWIDVLNFAIELQPEFVKPIIKFIQRRNHEGIDEKLVRIIMDVSPDNFDDKFRNLFFNTIFDYYKAKGKTIYNINDSLAKFVTKSNQLIFTPFFNINKLNDSVIYIQSNQILIIEELLKKHLHKHGFNDVELNNNSISPLINCITKDDFIFSSASKMIQFNNRNLIDDAGDEYTLLAYTKKVGNGQNINKYTKERETFSSCAGAALYKRSLVIKLGCFDENFFAYMEDVDLAYRAQINGYKNVYCPESIVYHIGSGSSGSKYNEFKIRLSARNNVLVIYKNLPIPQKIINIAFIFLGFLIKYLFFVKKGFGKVYLTGIKEGLNDKSKIRKVHYQNKNFKNYFKIEWKLIVNTIKLFKK